MISIPPELYKELQNVLLKVPILESQREILAIFSDTRLRLWQDTLPIFNNSSLIGRTNSIVHFLSTQYNKLGRNALVLFLEVLSDHVDVNDLLHTQLKQLAHNVKPFLVTGSVVKQEALMKYRELIRRTNTSYLLQGQILPGADQILLNPEWVNIVLNSVYVDPRVIPYRQKLNKTRLLKSTTGSIYQYLHPKKRWKKNWDSCQTEGYGTLVEEILRKHVQVVILGGAGAGKTTLLRYLAWSNANHSKLLPLLINLHQIDIALNVDTGVINSVLDYLCIHAIGDEKKILHDALSEMVTSQNVIWLLDGLDEVRLHRREILETLSYWAGERQRMVITTRPVNYEFITGIQAFYELLPFSIPDSFAFTRNWFFTVAFMRNESETEQQKWAENRIAWFKKQMDSHSNLRDIVGNPLLLSFLLLLADDRENRDLPLYPKDLCAGYVENLFIRSHTGEILPGVSNLDESREIMLWGYYQIALCLQSAGKDVLKYSLRNIKNVLAEKLNRVLRGMLRRWHQPDIYAEKIVSFWLYAGLLEKRCINGEDYLSFKHLLFQVYGVARSLADSYRRDPQGLWEALLPHLLEEEWGEIISLAIAQLHDSSVILRKIVDFEVDKTEDRQYLLILAATTLTQGATVRSATKNYILDELIKVFPTDKPSLELEYVLLNIFSELVKLPGYQFVAQRIAEMVCDSDISLLSRSSLVGLLSQAGRSYDFLVRELLMGNIDRLSEKTKYETNPQTGGEILVAFALDNRLTSKLRMNAAELVRFRGFSDEVTAVCLAFVQDKTLEYFDRKWGVETLTELGLNEAAVEAWKLLTQDKETKPLDLVPYTKQLAESGQTNSLLEVVSDENRRLWVRVQTTEILTELGYVDEAVNAWLLLAQGKKVIPQVRRQAAENLEELQCFDKAAEAWLSLVKDTSAFVNTRLQAIDALVTLGLVDKLADAWSIIAQDPKLKLNVRIAAIDKLSEMNRRDSVVNAWVSMACNSTNPAAQQRAIDALVRLREIDNLLSLAHNPNVHVEVREKIANLLIYFDRIEQSIEVYLKMSQEGDLKLTQATKTMRRLGRSKEMKKALAALVNDNQGVDDPWLRADVATALVDLGETSLAINVLASIANNSNIDFATRVHALTELGKCSSGDSIKVWVKMANNANLEIKNRQYAIRELGEMQRFDLAIHAWLNLAGEESVPLEDRSIAIRNVGRAIQLGYTDNFSLEATKKMKSKLSDIADNTDISNNVRKSALWALEMAGEKEYEFTLS